MFRILAICCHVDKIKILFKAVISNKKVDHIFYNLKYVNKIYYKLKF
jgi:hypothetical protein